MNLTNYHSHCSYCDGKAPMEEFVVSAINKGFTAYGISSHAPLPFKTHWSLRREYVADYLDEITRLKAKYKDQIELYAGMEIDYLNEDSNPASAYFQGLRLDYRIGSVHLIYAPDGAIIDVDVAVEKFKSIVCEHYNNDLVRLVNDYFDSLERMLLTGGFDFVGHFDKIYNNACEMDALLPERDWYKERIKCFLNLVASKKVMLEMNTKAFLRKGYVFPHERHWGLIQELNIPIVINSDAHYPEKVNEGREIVIELLKEHGFTHAMQLRNNNWINLPL